MRKKIVFMFICSMGIAASAGILTDIFYFVENVDGNQWRYDYFVLNTEMTDGIEQFTVWFDYTQYESLQITSDVTLSSAWDQLVWPPNKTLLNNGGFDALALVNPIAVGQAVSGFSVSFIWNGPDEPGSQLYEIVNPYNPGEVLDWGFTVLIPEPLSISFLIVGICLLKKRY